ncbi:MAG TPA: transketolase C-terminal domain-containing protein [Clostridia bacterium]|nr:transketolase C-terminal domain-containing protein [Clostridia bacterium]
MGNQRQVFGETLVEIGHEDERIVVLEADLGKSTMTCLFKNEFPNRYFEMGIAEANMTSFAAGLALAGKIPFTNSFAVFSGGRAFDQIRQGICTANLNVKIQGSSSGFSDYGDGATHQCIEDLAIMCALPNMTVLVPMDAAETKKIVKAAVGHNGPVYIRNTRSETPDLSDAEKPFVIGEPEVIREGNDIVIFACGVMVSKAVEAASTLEGEGLSIRVVNVSTLKPFPYKKVCELSQGFKGVVTAEEHSIIGGLSASVAFGLKGIAIPIECVAVEDVFGQSAEKHEDLLSEYKLTAESICDKVHKFI